SLRLHDLADASARVAAGGGPAVVPRRSFAEVLRTTLYWALRASPISSRWMRNQRRRVAQLGRAPVSKTGGWGFESLRACKGNTMNRQMKRMQEKAERQQKRSGVDRQATPAATARRAQTQEKRKRTGIRQFLKEVRQELKMVDWPNRRELVS